MKKIALFLVAVLALVSCGSEKNPQDELKEFKISDKSANISLRVATGHQILYSPEEAFGKITWTSSNAEVAKVDSKGYVEAMSEGDATITGKLANGFTQEAKVNVVSDQQYFQDNTNLYLAIPWRFNQKGYDFKNEEGKPLTCGDIGANFPEGDPRLNMVIDTVYEFMYNIVDDGLYLGGDNRMTGIPGLCFSIWTSAFVSTQANAFFALTTYTVNSDIEGFMEQEGYDVEKMDFIPPCQILASRFDKDAYVEFFTKAFTGQEVSRDDYVFMGYAENENFADKAAEVIQYVRNEEEGTLGGYTWGTLTKGAFRFDSHPNGSDLIVSAYNISGEFFGGSRNPMGLKEIYLTVEDDDVEEDGWYLAQDQDGNIVMEDFTEYTLSKGMEDAVVAPRGMSYQSLDVVRRNFRVNQSMTISFRQGLDNLKFAQHR